MLPLYNIILKNISKKPLTNDEINHCINEINKCSPEDMEIIYMLILSFCDAEKILTSYYPYNSYQNVDGIIFDFKSFPIKLQNIIFKFVCKIRYEIK